MQKKTTDLNLHKRDVIINKEGENSIIIVCKKALRFLNQHIQVVVERPNIIDENTVNAITPKKGEKPPPRIKYGKREMDTETTDDIMMDDKNNNKNRNKIKNNIKKRNETKEQREEIDSEAETEDENDKDNNNNNNIYYRESQVKFNDDTIERKSDDDENILLNEWIENSSDILPYIMYFTKVDEQVATRLRDTYDGNVDLILLSFYKARLLNYMVLYLSFFFF